MNTILPNLDASTATVSGCIAFVILSFAALNKAINLKGIQAFGAALVLGVLVGGFVFSYQNVPVATSHWILGLISWAIAVGVGATGIYEVGQGAIYNPLASIAAKNNAMASTGSISGLPLVQGETGWAETLPPTTPLATTSAQPGEFVPISTGSGSLNTPPAAPKVTPPTK